MPETGAVRVASRDGVAGNTLCGRMVTAWSEDGHNIRSSAFAQVTDGANAHDVDVGATLAVMQAECGTSRVHVGRSGREGGPVVVASVLLWLGTAVLSCR
jgi:hypothetical protein